MCSSTIFLYFSVAVLFFIYIAHLVQLHVGQAGSCVTGIFLRIGHCVAVQSQQLLQRKLSSLQGVTEGFKGLLGFESGLHVYLTLKYLST